MVAPEWYSRATMQIGSGRSPSGWWNSKSGNQTSRNWPRGTSHLPPEATQHQVIARLDEVVAEGELEQLGERRVRPLGGGQIAERRSVRVCAEPHVGLDADPLVLGGLRRLQRRLGPSVLPPVGPRELQ